MDNLNCQHCDRPMAGRFDKKFCNDQCRASYHNIHRRKHERMISAVNRQIRRNRAILKRFSPEGKATVRKERLVDAGFLFQYFSSIYQTAGLTYYFCYEYGFAAIMQQSKTKGESIPKVLIIQSQEHMKGKFDPWKNLKS